MRPIAPKTPPAERPRRAAAGWALALGCVLVFLVCLFQQRQNRALLADAPAFDESNKQSARPRNLDTSAMPKRAAPAASRTKSTAEEIVARRLKIFSSRQRALVRRLAAHYKLGVPPEVEKFFDALDVGDWEEAQRLFKDLEKDDASHPRDPALQKFWRPIQEAFGADQQVHLWPAQQLLDYGNGILNSLQPGMAYIGGTDAGCFICAMLNATSDSEQHTTLTQNALVDASYLEFLRATTDGALNIPSDDDAQAAVQQYLADAAQRLAHDQQFPDEPKQLLPGENVSIVDGKPSAEGQVAVMQINNVLLQDLVRMNPDVSFGLEESFPLPATYPGGAPLGPIFQLNAPASLGADSAITPDAANQVVNYWQGISQKLQSDPDAAGSAATLGSFSHDANAQGNLLANNNYPDQALQAYQAALNISPDNLDAVKGLVQLYLGEGRPDDASQALDAFLQNNPQKNADVTSLRNYYLPGK